MSLKSLNVLMAFAMLAMLPRTVLAYGDHGGAGVSVGVNVNVQMGHRRSARPICGAKLSRHCFAPVRKFGRGLHRLGRNIANKGGIFGIAGRLLFGRRRYS